MSDIQHLYRPTLSPLQELRLSEISQAVVLKPHCGIILPPSAMSRLPPGHPAVDTHEHHGLKCPLANDTDHAYCPPQPGDIRSVCPALNTMANHGYIPRDGKDLTYGIIKSGLEHCYNLSTPLSTVLTTGGFLLISRSPLTSTIDLYEVGIHNGVEHDASLVHRDCPPSDKYAPTEIVDEWVDDLKGDIRPVGSPVVDAEDVARMRVRRERASPLDSLHAEIARGEMAIILGVWEMDEDGGKKGVPVDWLMNWLKYETLPDGWKPDRVQGLMDVVQRSKMIRGAAERFREQEGENEEKENNIEDGWDIVAR